MEIIGILAIKCIKTVFRQKSKRNFMFLSSAIVCGCLMLMRFGSGDRLYSYLTSVSLARYAPPTFINKSRSNPSINSLCRTLIPT